MEFSRKEERTNPGTLQVRGERLHLSACVRYVSVADSWSHDATTLDSNLQAFESVRNLPQRIVGAIQAVEAAGMILFVQTLRPQKQMEVAKSTLNIKRQLVLEWGG